MKDSLVTLTCSSDANPPATYTWYKNNQSLLSPPQLVFTSIQSSDSGEYYCTAENELRKTTSELLSVNVKCSLTSAAAGTITVVLLVLVLLAVFLWIRREELFTQQCERRERPDTGAEMNVGPGFDSPSSAAGQQDELHYASVSFSQNQGDTVYSNIRGHHQTETEEHEEEVEYSVVRFNSSSESGRRRQEEETDPFALYSTVNKNT
ncbi:hypothetical protein INR49_020788 [Caranx melampygus]|nr:hypothetical protein INR49_020788 [Caranx melampygus]